MKYVKLSLTAAGLLLALLSVPPRLAQEAAPDSTAQQEAAEEEARRWGAGVQISPLTGLSVRYALTERFTVQVAALPFFLSGERGGGGRLIFKLYVQPKYHFNVAGGGALFVSEEMRFPFTEERGRDRKYWLFATLGGEYRFAKRLGLSGGLGISYLVQRSPFIDRNDVFPTLDLGLHYYF